jgi:peroxiredoxin
VEESPLLKELYAQYKERGVAVIGISLDEDVKLVREMVANKGMNWTQVVDADHTIQKLFNVKGTPTYFLLDREGKLVAKDIPFKKLNDAITELLKK